MPKLSEKYKWVPAAHKDRLVENMTPDFLRFMEAMNVAIEVYEARKRQVAAAGEEKVANIK